MSADDSGGGSSDYIEEDLQPHVHALGVGTGFDSAADFIAAANALAEKHSYNLKTTTNRAQVKDKPGHVLITCSRGGAPQRKKDLDQTKSGKRRQCKTIKCGCKFRLCARPNEDGTGYMVYTSNLQHTNGCNPSQQQSRLVERRKGHPIAPEVLQALVALVKVNHSLPLSCTYLTLMP